jgi:hypothetical protein
MIVRGLWTVCLFSISLPGLLLWSPIFLTTWYAVQHFKKTGYVLCPHATVPCSDNTDPVQTSLGYIRRNRTIQTYIRINVGHCRMVRMRGSHASYGHCDILCDTARPLVEFAMVGLPQSHFECTTLLMLAPGWKMVYHPYGHF